MQRPFEQFPHRFNLLTIRLRIETLSRLSEEISLATSINRAGLFARSLPILAELRQVAMEYFELSSPYILQCLTELEKELIQLSSLKNGTIVEDRLDGEGSCAACGNELNPSQTILEKLKARQFMCTGSNRVFCRTCCGPILATLKKLKSRGAFEHEAVMEAYQNAKKA